MANNIIDKIVKGFVNRSSEILLAGQIVSGIASVVSAINATNKVKNLLSEEAATAEQPITRKEVVKKYWKHYIPTAITLGTGIACGVAGYMGYKNGLARASAAAAVLEMSNAKLTAYTKSLEDKMEKEVGKEKAEVVKKEAKKETKEKLNNIIISGENRYFIKDKGVIFEMPLSDYREKWLDMRDKLQSEMFVTIDEWHDLLGIDHVTSTEGFDATKDPSPSYDFDIITEGSKIIVNMDYDTFPYHKLGY